MYSRMSLGSFLLLTGAACCLAQGVARGTPPKITFPNTPAWPEPLVHVRDGGTESFGCKANGEPAPTYKWTLNGTDFYQIPNIVTFDEVSGVLTIGSAFSKAFNGDYQCTAINENGKAMTPFVRILKAEISGFTGNTSDPRYLYGKFVGDYLQLPCINPPKSSPPLKFFWRRKQTVGTDEIQDEISPNDARLEVGPDGILYFLWLEQEDSKFKYFCGGNNKISGLDAISMITYEIEVKPRLITSRVPVLKYNKDVVGTVGKTVELVCIFSYYKGDAEEFKIEWSLKRDILGEGGKLTIPSVELSQEGQYLCEATLGTNDPVRGTVDLKLFAPPQFVKGKELKDVSAALGNTAVFHCGTDSHNSFAEPTVWMVNAVPIIGCPVFTFECKRKQADGTPECIPEKDRCNNSPDCQDRSDEENCDTLTCNEGLKACNGICVDPAVECTVEVCAYPNFQCTDDGPCIVPGENDDRCSVCPDQQGCPGRQNITVGRFVVTSDRSQLMLADVQLADSFCFQCMARNEHGTLVGDGCLTVIDKIAITLPPDEVYTITPDMTLVIVVDAVTDAQWQQQMKFEWFWYEIVMDPNTGKKKTVPVALPPPSYEDVFKVSGSDHKTLTITVPALDPEDEISYDVYEAIKDRQYAVKISHEYDTVYGRFTIEGEPASRPTVAPVVQEPLWPKLWFLVLIFGIIILFVIIALIVCYMYKNRGGTYPLDRKEVKAGHDPEKELAMDGFTDAGRLGADVKEYDDMLKDDGPPY